MDDKKETPEVESGETTISTEQLMVEINKLKDTRENDSTEDNFKTSSSNLFRAYSTSGHSSEMKKKIADRVYVMGEIAEKGQSTAIYAQYNTGKTLLTLNLIIEAIDEGLINGKEVTYVNADDDERGIVQKTELAEKHGFELVSPGSEGMTREKVIAIMEEMIEADIARKNIVIIDTHKSFVDPNDKRDQKAFNNLIKDFVAKGGTIIILCNTNKHKREGVSVQGGTSDLPDAVSASYILDTVDETDEFRTVEFSNSKNRGGNVAKATYRYKHLEEDYLKVLESVSLVSKQERNKVIAQKITKENLEAHAEEIEVIESLIKSGITKRTELCKEVHKETGASHSKIKEILKAHEGDLYEHGHRWQKSKGDKNAKIYSLTPRENPYIDAKCPEF
jgi:archaellum biogenesis ATPase FlaH